MFVFIQYQFYKHFFSLILIGQCGPT